VNVEDLVRLQSQPDDIRNVCLSSKPRNVPIYPAVFKKISANLLYRFVYWLTWLVAFLFARLEETTY
jgi:hypothetical protein